MMHSSNEAVRTPFCPNPYMEPHRYLSSYLATPDSTNGPAKKLTLHKPDLRRYKLGPRFYVLWQLRPHLPSRNWAALSLWAVLLVVGLYGFENHRLPRVPADVAAADGRAQQTPSASPVALASTAKVTELPGGPTDQLLPPGTMAPMHTYKNSYSRGQCTWYVAGRRPVPNNWGHARTWFARAKAAGRATGAVPAVAAIAWTPAGRYGHVAIVEDVNTFTGQVLISEMNYRGPYKLTKRWVPTGSFKYIY